MASSTVALATEAMVFSVAGSTTSKRPPSEAFRHLPPIHRSVGTLARRFSYMALTSQLAPLIPAKAGIQRWVPAFAGTSGMRLPPERTPHRLDDARHGRQHDVFQIVRRRQRDVRRGDAHRRAVEIVEGLVGDDGDDLGAP